MVSAPPLHFQLGDSSKQPDLSESYTVNNVKVEGAAAKQQESANHLWIADTGAERNMTGFADWLAELQRLRGL